MVENIALCYAALQSSAHTIGILSMYVLQITMLLLTAIDVQVDLLDGNSVNGTLSSLGTEELILLQNEQSKSIALAKVISVTSNLQKPEPSGDFQGHIILVDGSKIACKFNSLTARQVSVESSAGGALVIPRPDARAVRLSAASPEWTKEWRAFLQRNNDEDMLILTKRDGSGLDFYSGVISAASEDKVDFVLDAETVPVPRDRIYGLIFAATETKSNDTIALRLFDGSEVRIHNVIMEDDFLKAETSWNQLLTLRLASVRSIDFSRGRFHYLSDLDPVRETYSGIHPGGSLLDELLRADEVLGKEVLRLWKLHRDEVPTGPFGPLPLTLRGKVYEKGLWLFPRCRIDYALDGEYSRFQTIAGVDDEVAFNCSEPDSPSKVQLTILVDGDEVWKRLIEAPADPAGINLDVSGVRTLSILVDFGDDDSACDFLDLADARLLVVP